MAKGNICPYCGEQKFQRDRKHGGAMTCSACNVRGWLSGPDPMLGKGNKCKFCGRAMMRVVADLPTGTKVRHCYNCGATVF